jgi:S-layer protein
VITTITDYSTEDTLQIGNATPFTKFTPTSGNSLYDVIDAALNGSGTPAGAAADAARWFNYGGDTYVVKQDATATSGSGDIIVKLVGTFTLTSMADQGNATGLIGLSS